MRLRRHAACLRIFRALVTMAPTRIKVQEEIWTTELAISCCIFVLCIIGMSVGLSGLTELPKCKFGAPECYFFVQVAQHARQG